MEKKSINSTHFLKPIKFLFRRFHLILFFIFVAACLAAAVWLLNSTIQDSSIDSDYTSSINAGTIDEATLNRLNSLHTSNQAPASPELPAGRVNPFNE